jgi:hypothetical protein
MFILSSILKLNFHLHFNNVTGCRGSIVSIAARQGLDGLRFEPRWVARDFLFSSLQRSTQPPVPCVPNLFPGDKATGAWRCPPTELALRLNVGSAVACVWNVMAHAQKPDFVFRRNGRVRLNRWGRQFSLLLAAEVCASAAVILDTPCSEVVWRVLDTHSIRQFPLKFPSRASPCAITFQLDSTTSLSSVSSMSCYGLTCNLN